MRLAKIAGCAALHCTANSIRSSRVHVMLLTPDYCVLRTSRRRLRFTVFSQDERTTNTVWQAGVSYCKIRSYFYLLRFLLSSGPSIRPSRSRIVSDGRTGGVRKSRPVGPEESLKSEMYERAQTVLSDTPHPASGLRRESIRSSEEHSSFVKCRRKKKRAHQCKVNVSLMSDCARTNKQLLTAVRHYTANVC